MRPILPVLTAAAVVFGTALAQNPILLNGQIWDGNGGPLAAGVVYHVVGGPGSCGISVPTGQTLTIQPGAIVKIAGCFLVSGTLDAIGTAIAPIEFTSVHDDLAGGDTNNNGGLTVPAAGDWANIEIFGTAHVEHCRVRYGGANGNAPLSLRNQPATIRHCVIDHAAGSGIKEALNATIEDCDFEYLAGIPVDGIDLKRLPQFSSNRALQCAGGEYARIVDATLLTGNLTMDPIHAINGSGVFVIDIGSSRSPRVGPGVTWTFPAGTVVKIVQSSGLLTSQGGRFDVQGTAARPVVFTSIDDDAFGGDTQNNGGATAPQPGDWWGIELQAGDTSAFDHAIIRHAGSPAAVRLSGSSASFVDCTIERSSADGLLFNNVAAPPASLRGCTIRDNVGRAVKDMFWTELEACSDNTTSNNGGGDHFHVQSGFVTVAATIDPGNYPGAVLEVANRVTINSGGALSLEAGVILKWGNFGYDTGINVNAGGRLLLNGTARRPVVLTSFRDDAWGGDTNGDGNATQPVAGDWERVWIGGGSIPPPVRLENVLIRFAGRSSNSLECQSSLAELRRVRVEHSGNDGLLLTDAQGSVDNLVVVDAADDGIQLNNRNFDVRHATVTGCGGAGLVRTGSWTGQVRNSISWGNSGGNFANLVAATVAFSDGDFAGQNGNVMVDPQFENVAAGNLHLRATSPCLGSADFATAQAVGKDHDETSRLQDHALTGSLQADMGAYERPAYTMATAGDPILGSVMSFTLQGPGGIGAVFASVSPAGGLLVPPFGVALIGFPNAPLPPSLLLMGQSASFVLPNAAAFHGVRFDVQGIGVQVTGPLVGGFTNVDRNRMRFD
ncbi:MAG: right-handed parallel beta-helix repeat-containing protein [Planctomycetes bacterium]|nr:right-handed parallel beta-helix repeat-containing protein [Planctomycetota bacterium]